MKLRKKSLRKIISFAAVLFAILISAYIVRSIDTNPITDAITNQGVTGWAIYLLFIIVSVVFSPVNALIMMPIALIGYGFWLAVTLTFVGNVIGGAINFFVARKFGRPVVGKIVGKKLIEKVDEFTEVAGWKGFLLLRILGSNYYDYVSYAAGFTNLKNSIYFAITVPTSLVWTFLLFYLIEKAITFNRAIYIVVIATVYVASLYLGYEAWKKIQVKKTDTKLQ
jgi:uncharacterized membrane protein YdjX (TVP38/TMEM64 family)